jgi:predicted ABC-type ATPase
MSPEKVKEVLDRKSDSYPVADESGEDTMSRHLKSYDPNGDKYTFTKERQEFHEAVIAHVMAKASHDHQGGQKVVTILGGGGGAGKSTLLKNGHVNVGESVTVNADDIKEMIPEYREMLANKDSKAAGFAHEESSYLSKEIMRRAEVDGYDYVLDGTGDSTIEALRKKLSHAKEQGYFLDAQYVTVDTQTALDRNIARARKTGRMVPPAALKHAHAQVSRVFPQAIKEGLFHNAKLWDTNDSTADEDRTELIAEYKDGNLTVHNEAKYKRFLAKADEK